MTADSRIKVYLISKKVQKVRDMHVENLVNFDVYDNEYLLIYRENNIIDVFTIDMYIYLQYKMRLPLYKQYETYYFKKTKLFNLAS